MNTYDCGPAQPGGRDGATITGSLQSWGNFGRISGAATVSPEPAMGSWVGADSGRPG
jgi:hypothetical protein